MNKKIFSILLLSTLIFSNHIKSNTIDDFIKVSNDFTIGAVLLSVAHIFALLKKSNYKGHELNKLLAIAGIVYSSLNSCCHLNRSFDLSNSNSDYKENNFSDSLLISSSWIDLFTNIYMCYVSYLLFSNKNSKLHGNIGFALSSISFLYWLYISKFSENSEDVKEEYSLNSNIHLLQAFISSLLLIKK